jgi:tetratricopeptide (TPR) repeat protein
MLRYIPIALLVLLIGCSQSMYTQGRKLVDQGDYDSAIELFYEHIRANPESGMAWRELGIASYKKGDLIKAEDALKQANAIRPDARSNLYLGLIYEQQEMYGKAIDAYRASLSLKPGSNTRGMIRSHMDRLVSRKLQQEVSQALANEAAIDADTIPDNTIAVVDFDDTHLSPEMAPITKGLAEFTAMDLAKVNSLRVIDRLKIDAILNELKLSSSKYADPSTAPRMGRLLGSNRIITGSVLGIGDDAIQLDGAVVSIRDSSAAMTGSTEGTMDKFFAVQKDFIFKVVDSLGINLTAEERDAIMKVPTESYLAFMAYCRGLDLRSRGMYDAAQNEFRQAVNEDKSFEEAAVQQKAMSQAPATAAEEAGAFQQFETELTSASEEEMSGDGLGRFQSGSLGAHGFMHDSGSLERYGNTPDSPIRTIDIDGIGTVIIRGNLDAEP